jgi:cytochrome c-type biogenesis protein CcsB
MKLLLKLIPWFFVALFGSEIAALLAPKKDGEFHVREFGRLPVLMNGRIQPFDSIGRNTLLQIRSTADVPLEEVPSWKFWHHPKKLKSTEWLLEVMFRPDQADERPIFLIHHPELLSELNLQDKGVDKSGLRYYTFNQLKPILSVVWDQGNQARKVQEASQRSPLQRQVIKLQNAVFLYQSLKTTVRPAEWEDFAKELDTFAGSMEAGVAAMQAREAGKPYDEQAFNQFAEVALAAFKFKDDSNAGQSYPLVVPPRKLEAARDDWGNIWAGLLDSVRDRQIFPPVRYLASIASAYGLSQPGEFNRAVEEYRGWLAQKFTPELKKGREEFYYNDLKAFLHAMIIYLCAFVLAGISLLALSLAPNLSESLRRSAFYLIILAGVVHTFGLGFRMHLEGRPPVTNLYSSAIFIGWGAMILGLVLERIYRIGIGNVVSSLAGFVTLMIAHNLALGGDTMEMLRAVLDTNFWLATHVVVVTLGYASTFVAGLLAVIYIVLGLFTPLLSQKLAPRVAASGAAPGSQGPARASSSQPAIGSVLAKMVYGIICFATLFSFTGTVLGGIWADQSWGRFWGWDPKENGALLIVLWNAMILHARWGGLVRERGIMNLAIFGNIVTSFSWFGVNLLEIGLHSYGFTDSGAEYLLNFVTLQFVLLGNGLMALPAWRSYSPAGGPALHRLFRALLGVLNLLWLSAAVAWFVGIYYAVPSLGLVGRIGSFVFLALILILAAAAALVNRWHGKPQKLNLAAPIPSPAG